MYRQVMMNRPEVDIELADECEFNWSAIWIDARYLKCFPEWSQIQSLILPKKITILFREWKKQNE